MSDFVVDTAQVVVFEPLAAFFGELFEQFAQALNVVAVDIEALLQQVAQCTIRIAMVDQLIAELGE